MLGLAANAGSSGDIVARLKSVLPTRWFGDSTPTLDALLSGLAGAWQALFAQLGAVAGQTRIATASGFNLDLVALDFYGAGLARRPGETDGGLRGRIAAGLLAPRGTRAAVRAALAGLGAGAPRIFEPARIADTGAWNTGATLGYGVAGAWGSHAVPFQCFVIATRPATGVAWLDGYGASGGGYGAGRMAYAAVGQASLQVGDADTAAAVAACMPVATTAWIAITD